MTDRAVLVGVLVGLAVSLGLHVAALAGVGVAPWSPWSWSLWSWALHLGAIVGCWYVAGRIAAGGLRGVAGLLRIRRMVPIPFRLALGAATLNAALAAGLVASGDAEPARAWSAYWTMMYLLLAIAGTFVLPRVDRAPAGVPR